jgi:hypothetical protein
MLFFNGEASSPTLVGDLAPHEYENQNQNYRKIKLKKSCEFLSLGFLLFFRCKEVYL